MLAIVVIASMFLAQSPPATPVPAAPKQEAPKQEPPQQDAPKQETPKQESPKPAAPPAEPAKPAPKPPTVVTANDVLHVAPQTGLPREKFTFFGEEFDCELCLTPASRNAGMGARTEFPEGTAMIFVHPTPMLLNYWMKDCLIDMDMVMVDDKGVICALHEAVRERLRTKGESLQDYEDRLRRYLSNRRAKYVLEFPSGTIARLQPKLGQRIAIDWKSLDARAE
ncbi:MAG: DUF192 domain-containing protein [bacterium]|jgi:uncharacterized membrane protein (UPF0127 family)